MPDACRQDDVFDRAAAAGRELSVARGCDSPSRDEVDVDVTRLAEAVISLRPLIDVLPPPIRLISGNRLRDAGGLPGLSLSLELLNRIASRLGAPAFELWAGEPERSMFARVVTNRLALGAAPGRELSSSDTAAVDAAVDIDALVDQAVARSFDAYCDRAETLSTGGVLLNLFAAGDPSRTAVVIASICGMPARLCEPWIRRLAEEYFVITWETRGLFGRSSLSSNSAHALDCSVEAQTMDAFAAMDHFGVRSAHFIGMCGGALIALRAAAQAPDRVSSLSLWHGDLDLGSSCPKTSHQRDLQALMAMATEQRISPRDLHAVLCQAVSAHVPDDLGPSILYPYARPDLLFTYCRLNGAIMRTSAAPCLPLIRQPALVVTSEADDTAHPDASKRVAAALPHAALRVEQSGNHISLFRGPAHLLQRASDFIREADSSQK